MAIPRATMTEELHFFSCVYLYEGRDEGGGGVKNILTPSDDEDRVHAGVILKCAGEQAVQVVALTPAHQ